MWAQNQPDAGKVLREIQKAPGVQQSTPAPLAPPSAPAEEAPLPSKPGETVFVSAFKIVATKFPERDLQETVKLYIGQRLTLSDLQAAARRISDYYRRHDILAHAVLPPQTIRNGVVEIDVIEGSLGKIKVDPSSKARLDPDVAKDIVANRLESGEVKPSQLDEAVAVVNEIPGVKASSTLVAGENRKQTDIVLKLEDKPIVNGSATVDNGGSVSTGLWRGIASISADDPFGRGEQFSATALKTDGSSYLKLSASLPVGFKGAALAVYTSALDYTVGWEFENLKLHGSAWTFGSSLTYPIRRTDAFAMTVSATVEHKQLVDFSDRSTLDQKQIDLGTVTLASTIKDDVLGGGTNTLSLSGTTGNLGLGGDASSLSTDQTTARTNGPYWKLAVNASREQATPIDTVTVQVSTQFQFAPQNLDGSEQISFGGMDTLRGYPSGQASGDDGALAMIELHWKPTNAWNIYPFYDTGLVRQHARPWTGWQPVTGQPNVYALQSTGLGASWAPKSYLTVQAIVAAAIGVNPAHDANDNNSDGTRNGVRGWVQSVLTF